MVEQVLILFRSPIDRRVFTACASPLIAARVDAWHDGFWSPARNSGFHHIRRSLSDGRFQPAMEPPQQDGLYRTVRRVPHDLWIIQPAADVQCTNPVRIVPITTKQTDEPVPSAVLMIHEAALWTRLRSIGRVDLLMTKTFRQRLKCYTIEDIIICLIIKINTIIHSLG